MKRNSINDFGLHTGFKQDSNYLFNIYEKLQNECQDKKALMFLLVYDAIRNSSDG